MGTNRGVKLGDFCLDEMLADLESDEGADPVMLFAPMPSWFREALIETFAAEN